MKLKRLRNDMNENILMGKLINNRGISTGTKNKCKIENLTYKTAGRKL